MIGNLTPSITFLTPVFVLGCGRLGHDNGGFVLVIGACMRGVPFVDEVGFGVASVQDDIFHSHLDEFHLIELLLPLLPTPIVFVIIRRKGPEEPGFEHRFFRFYLHY